MQLRGRSADCAPEEMPFMLDATRATYVTRELGCARWRRGSPFAVLRRAVHRQEYDANMDWILYPAALIAEIFVAFCYVSISGYIFENF